MFVVNRIGGAGLVIESHQKVKRQQQNRIALFSVSGLKNEKLI